jgi:hypothetical protein
MPNADSTIYVGVYTDASVSKPPARYTDNSGASAVNDEMRWSMLEHQLTEAQRDALDVLVRNDINESDDRFVAAIATLRAMPKDLLTQVLSLVDQQIDQRKSPN